MSPWFPLPRHPSVRPAAGWFSRIAGVLAAASGITQGVADPASATASVHWLVPGFQVDELPVQLSNQNSLRFAPDGTLTSLGYDGRIWRLRDTNGDGLEDKADLFWDGAGTSVPVGMAWTTHGLYVSSHGKVSLLRDLRGTGRADTEEVIASGWPGTDVGTGGVDATAVTVDDQGRVYFGILAADYSNAYRLRKRQDLTPADKQWLIAHGKAAEGDPQEVVSLYDLHSPRGTIQRWDPRTRTLESIATGIRVPYSLAFNRRGDLFNTDQEGETWMPHGNPLDELNHIIPGRNYGFPPVHPQWLPGLVSEAPVVGFGPQHESTCGFVFNEPHPATRTGSKLPRFPLPAAPRQGRFGPREWEGDVIVAGESRGKIWRVPLHRTATGYAGREVLIARFDLLVTDVAISPKGDLYVSCHSSPPDWGTGPQGAGHLYRISYRDHAAPQPLSISPRSATEVEIPFSGAIDASVLASRDIRIEFGEYVRAADRLETLKPPYAVVRQQDATPRGHLEVRGARLESRGRTLVLTTDPHPLPVTYSVSIGGIKAAGAAGPGTRIDLDYDLTEASQPESRRRRGLTAGQWHQPVAWAPKQRASSGTDSRIPVQEAGDWENGRALFNGDKLQCARCHRIRGVGPLTGPDLSNLKDRDPASVLRDIRDPNATLHPDYVTYQADLKNGDTLTGFISKTGPDAQSGGQDRITLVDAAGHERSIPRSELLNLHPTGLSLMPTGLLDGQSDTAVRDLLTFLTHEPMVRTAEEVRPILTGIAAKAPSTAAAPLHVLLVASKQDHGPGQHDYPAWQKAWAAWMQGAASGRVDISQAWEWPTPEQWKGADVVVFYYWNHDDSAARLAELDAFQKRGGGLVLLHSAVISDHAPEALALRVGLAATPDRVKYRHMPFTLELAPHSPFTRGLPQQLGLLDEPYWPMIGDATQVSVLASTFVDGARRPLIWTTERQSGRVFASIPGHYAWTLQDPLWRVVILRGIAWAGRREIDSLVDLIPPGTPR